jgi:hypothetical protein
MRTPRGRIWPLVPISYHGQEPLQFGSFGFRRAKPPKQAQHCGAASEATIVRTIMNFALDCRRPRSKSGVVTGNGKVVRLSVIPTTNALNGYGKRKDNLPRSQAFQAPETMT